MKLVSLIRSVSDKPVGIKQFAETPTELDDALGKFSDGLWAVAIRLGKLSSSASKGLALLNAGPERIAFISSVLATASKEVLDSLMANIDSLKDDIDLVKIFVETGVLMRRTLYESSRERVDKASDNVQTHINIGARDMAESKEHSQAYYNSLKVMHAFRGLVHQFNEVVATYNKLHGTNLVGAKTSAKFFKMNVDMNSPVG